MRPVFEYLDYRNYLRDAFEERKRLDTRLSYRKLAATLGLDASNLHKIFQARGHLPARCQTRVLKFLGLSHRSAEYFLLLVAHARERGELARMDILERARRLQDVPRLTLEDRELLFYQKWWTSVVRLLLEVHEGRAVADKLAKSVCPPITPTEAQASLDLLLELGLVKKAVSGRLKLGEAHLTAGGEKKSKAVHDYQSQIFELAIASLHRFSRNERDVSTVTFAVDEKAHQAILDILRECRRQVQKQADSTRQPKRVMQLAMAFFPVSSLPKDPS
ncbi:MAG: TIGR02147 family protein [Fibrobacteria bacterium]